MIRLVPVMFLTSVICFNVCCRACQSTFTSGLHYHGLDRTEAARFPDKPRAEKTAQSLADFAWKRLDYLINNIPGAENRLQAAISIKNAVERGKDKLSLQLGDWHYAYFPTPSETKNMLDKWPQNLTTQAMILKTSYPAFTVGGIEVNLQSIKRCHHMSASSSREPVSCMSFFKLMKDQFLHCNETNNLNGKKTIAHTLIAFAILQAEKLAGFGRYRHRGKPFTEELEHAIANRHLSKDPGTLCLATVASPNHWHKHADDLIKQLMENTLELPDNRKKLSSLAGHWKCSPDHVVEDIDTTILKPCNDLLNFLDGISGYLKKYMGKKTAPAKKNLRFAPHQIYYGDYFDRETRCLAHELTFKDHRYSGTREYLKNYFKPTWRL